MVSVRVGPSGYIWADKWADRKGERVEVDHEEAFRILANLQVELRRISDKDPEQEIQGIALPVMDSILGATRKLVPQGHPVLEKLSDLISPEAVEAGLSIRAVDLLLVVTVLLEVLNYSPPARESRPDWL